MGFFGAGHGWASLTSVTHILQWWNLAQLYLTYVRPKRYINHVTNPLISAGISIFSPEISKFCYIKKYRYRLIWYITFNSFNFSRVLNNCFNKHGYNFDGISKNNDSRPSKNKGILKKRSWRHNFCLWSHQQIFITWFKLYHRYGHVNKVW